AEVAQHGDIIAADVLAKSLDQARFADSRLTSQQHHLSVAAKRLAPTRQQQVELLVAADPRRQAARGGGLEPAARPACLAHAKHRDRLVDSFHAPCPEFLAYEQA